MSKKYKCMYCDYRNERNDLIDHIDRYHKDMIPKDYTATRLVFNLINKKTKGTCIVCKGESKWNEKDERYDRICSKQCVDKYKENLNKDIIKVHGRSIQDMLNDPEYQNNKMLNNRKIAGKYKFKDGGEHTYVGKYELELLKFFDIVLDVHSSSIITPGPTIEYTYKGETHTWITDLYYIPFNLVFDVKDGGNNPNTHPGYFDNKQKQIDKELAIQKLDKYNYIRLTNNDFAQLMSTLLDIKNKNFEKDNSFIYSINECMIGIDNNAIIHPQLYLCIFSNSEEPNHYGIMDNPILKTVYIHNRDTCKFDLSTIDDMEKKGYDIHIYKIDKSVDGNTFMNKVIEGYEFDTINPILNELCEYNKEYLIFACDKLTKLSYNEDSIDLGYNGIGIDTLEEEFEFFINEMKKEYKDLSIIESPEGYRLCNKSRELYSTPRQDLEFSDFIKNILQNAE